MAAARLPSALAPLAELPVAQRVVDFGLYHPAYQPLKLFESFAADPHGALVAALGSLQVGEVAGMQVLIAPAHGAWGPSLALLVRQFDGVTRPAHPNTRDTGVERSLRYKLAAPLWAVALRVFAFAAGKSQQADGAGLGERAFDLCRRVGATLDAFQSDGNGHDSGTLDGNQNGNRLVALEDAGYASRDRLRDLLERRTRRAGMLLSQSEVAGLWHPPSERLAHPRLIRYDPRQRELPDYLRDAPGAALGLLAPDATGFEGDEPQVARWPDAMRNRHLYMLGATRMGKSTLLLNLIAQDMLAGRGLCLIDPHGDLALDVLRRVPPRREADVFYLDLSDTAHPPALGLLQAADEWEKRLLVSDLLAILHRLFQASWGDRLEHILRHALLTLLAAEASPSGMPPTLRDIRPLLASKEYRQRLLERVPDPDLHTFWQSEFPGYAASAFAPVYNKLGLLLSSPVVRNIVGGAQTKLRAGPLMREGQILLVNLAQSLIGEDNAHFLGALLVSKIQLAAMHSLRLGREERSPFSLYVDEFQNFVVSSFEKILSEAGKAGLTLVMANQFLEQLGEGLPTAIRANTGTLVSFRVSAQSGRALEGEFGGLYGAKELVDLERGQAVARLGRAGDSFLIHTFPPLEPATLGTDADAPGRILDATHAALCRDKAEVEAELRASDEALRRMLEAAAQAEQDAKAARPARPASVKAAAKTNPAAKSARPPTRDNSVAVHGLQPSADDAPDEEPLDGDTAQGKARPPKQEPARPSRFRHAPQSARSRRVRSRAAPPGRATAAAQDGYGEGRTTNRSEDSGSSLDSAATRPDIPADEPLMGLGGGESSAGAVLPDAARKPAESEPRATAPAPQGIFFGLPDPVPDEVSGADEEGESRGGQPAFPALLDPRADS